MYPGNESEKTYLRKVIEEMKQRHNVSCKTIQVPDKGLNCARNIYATVKEANDGYSRNLLDLQNHTLMQGLFIYRKKKQSMGIF